MYTWPAKHMRILGFINVRKKVQVNLQLKTSIPCKTEQISEKIRKTVRPNVCVKCQCQTEDVQTNTPLSAAG